MKLYIFNVGLLTDNYHSNGSAVVVAKNRERAKALLSAKRRKYPDEDELVGPEPTEEEIAAGVEYPLRGVHEEAIYIHPDAGCC